MPMPMPMLRHLVALAALFLANGQALALSGTRALVADENALLSVVNVASPARPAQPARKR